MAIRSSDGRAVMVGGPEAGTTVYVGVRRPPARIDYETDGRLARYRRCTRFQFDPFRSGGAGHIGQTTYRFVGFVEAAR